MATPENPLTPLELEEEQWRSKLEAAKRRCDAASAQYTKALEEFQRGFYATPDGGLAVAYARREAYSTREDYMRVLSLFTKLVTEGRVPGK